MHVSKRLRNALSKSCLRFVAPMRIRRDDPCLKPSTFCKMTESMRRVASCMLPESRDVASASICRRKRWDFHDIVWWVRRPVGETLRKRTSSMNMIAPPISSQISKI